VPPADAEALGPDETGAETATVPANASDAACPGDVADAPVGDGSAEGVVDASPVEIDGDGGGGPDAASVARFGGSFEGGDVRDASVGACFDPCAARDARLGPCLDDVAAVTVGMGAAATTGS